MSRINEPAPALARARQLVDLYQTRIITSVALMSEVAELVTPDNVEEVIGLLPPEVTVQFVDWTRRLPPPDAPGIVCWPLPDKTTLALKQWLQRHEQGKLQESGV